MTNIIKYSLFSSYLTSVLLYLLIFKFKSNYFFENYPFILTFFIIILILFLGSLKNFNFNIKNFFNTIKFNIIDYLFLSDLIYNFIFIFLSNSARLSIEETIYTFSYFIVYLIFRISLFFLDFKQYKNFIIIIVLSSIVFITNIYYLVFFKFQLISVDGRISYNLIHPNLLSSIILIFISLVIYLALIEYFKNKISTKTIFYTILILLYSFLIFMTSSRGGMLGLIFGIFIITIILIHINYKINFKKSFLLSILILSLLLALVFIFLPEQFERLLGIFQKENLLSLGSRLHIWSVAFKSFLNAPILGNGPGVCNYIGSSLCDFTMVDAHNFLLEKLSNLGIVGTVIYLLPLILILKKSYEIVKNFKNECNNEVYLEKFSISIAIIFLIISVFTNSSFSPHYVLPIISFYLYMIFAIYINYNLKSNQNYEVTINIKLNLNDILKIIGTLILIYFLLKLSIFILPLEVYFETTQCHLILTFLITIFVTYFYILKPYLLIDKKQILNPNNENSKTQNYFYYMLTFLIVIIGIFLNYNGLNYFIAEKANLISCSYLEKLSFKNAEKYIDIALKYDHQNAAYILNKCGIMFLSELVNSYNLKNNPKINEIINILKSGQKLYEKEPLFKSLYEFFNNKYNGLELKTKNFNDDLISNYFIQNSQIIFHECVNIFLNNAYEQFIIQNKKIVNEINKIIEEEKTLKQNSKISKYFEYLSTTFKVGLNLEILWAEAILHNTIISVLRHTEAVSQKIPIKEYKKHSLAFAQQLDALSSIVVILPMVWRYSHNLSYEEFTKKFFKFFGENNPLVYISSYFLYSNENDINTHLNLFEDNLKIYIQVLKEFANKNFLNVINLKNELIKSNIEKQHISILLSWTYYKLGDLKLAREYAIYSHFKTAINVKRHFTYKRDTICNGKLIMLYYMPLQSYYNELLGLALIKYHNGNKDKLLQDIFEYLNKVISLN